MTTMPFNLIADEALPTPLGLIVLQTDETVEPEFHKAFAGVDAALYVSRIPSSPQVTPETLGAMEADIAAAADLLPKSLAFSVVGYGCTSASAIIGSDAVEALVKSTCNTAQVTNPMRAAITYARTYGLTRLALLSPYIAEVNTAFRAAFADAGIATDTFGTFGEAEEAKVARISDASIIEAAVALGQAEDVEGIFLSCTNLRTRVAIPQIAAMTGKPVFSSNSALSWHMKNCAKL